MLDGRGPVTGRALAGGPGTAGAGITSNLTALDRSLPFRDDLLHDPWRQALLNELPGGLAARWGAIGRRRPLVARSSGDDFRRNMVAAYIAIATQMPDNWLQCIMFTHQDTNVWSGMVGSVPATICDRRETTGFDLRYTAMMAPPDKNRRD